MVSERYYAASHITRSQVKTKASARKTMTDLHVSRSLLQGPPGPPGERGSVVSMLTNGTGREGGGGGGSEEGGDGSGGWGRGINLYYLSTEGIEITSPVL